MNDELRPPHLAAQNEGRPRIAIDPPAAPVAPVRAIRPESDELAIAELEHMYDQAEARGEVQLRDPALRQGFRRALLEWSAGNKQLTGPLHGVLTTCLALISATLGPGALWHNPIGWALF